MSAIVRPETWTELLGRLVSPPPRQQPEFGQWLRLRRRFRGLTQAQIAQTIGLDRTSLARIERGSRGVSWELGWRLTDATSPAQGGRVESDLT